MNAAEVVAIARRNAWTLLAFALAAVLLLLIGLIVSGRDWVIIVLVCALGCQTMATVWYRRRAR